jgi:dipicolinate synthase subunit A
MMHSRVAVLGGDRRELRIAERLAQAGHSVSLYGTALKSDQAIERPKSAADAVGGAEWIVTPSPGLGPQDQIYAPTYDGDIRLNDGLLGVSNAKSGGVVLGRASDTFMQAAARAGVRAFEMKDDPALNVINATAVAEAIVALVIEQTDRVLAGYRLLILGYGATGAPLLNRFISLGCDVSVAARRPEHRELIRQNRGSPIPFQERVQAMAKADIVINTVPDVNAVPLEAHAVLVGRILIDISSPPGGCDHVSARNAGVLISWARGLAGRRAPTTAGDAQFEFVKSAMASTADEKIVTR